VFRRGFLLRFEFRLLRLNLFSARHFRSRLAVTLYTESRDFSTLLPVSHLATVYWSLAFDQARFPHSP